LAEKLIKSKARVQKHGEVFTPVWMVQKMLDNEDIKAACDNLTATFLEPAAGDGNFLVAILMRKLSMVSVRYSKSLQQYTHYSLFALSTLYGIELLEDNTKMCVMNLFEVYRDFYETTAKIFNKKPSKTTLDNAKFIISRNIIQGNFLTRKTAAGQPIIFSEWQLTNSLRRNPVMLKVQRTEFSLDEIFAGNDKMSGEQFDLQHDFEQIDLFVDFGLDIEVEEKRKQRYKKCLITEVVLEEMEDD
jgi:hypothetical protein